MESNSWLAAISPQLMSNSTLTLMDSLDSSMVKKSELVSQTSWLGLIMFPHSQLSQNISEELECAMNPSQHYKFKNNNNNLSVINLNKRNQKLRNPLKKRKNKKRRRRKKKKMMVLINKKSKRIPQTYFPHHHLILMIGRENSSLPKTGQPSLNGSGKTLTNKDGPAGSFITKKLKVKVQCF